jgi:hypothetical protein
MATAFATGVAAVTTAAASADATGDCMIEATPTITATMTTAAHYFADAASATTKVTAAATTVAYAAEGHVWVIGLRLPVRLVPAALEVDAIEWFPANLLGEVWATLAAAPTAVTAAASAFLRLCLVYCRVGYGSSAYGR